MLKKGIDFTGIGVCWVCFSSEGDFVMQKRNSNCRDEQGRWDTGGGALEFGEDVEERLKKEIKEEFGAEILKFDFLGYRSVNREVNKQKTHWLTLDFKVLVDKSQVKNNEPHKFSEIGWFNLENLPQPLHSQLPKFFDKYKKVLL